MAKLFEEAFGTGVGTVERAHNAASTASHDTVDRNAMFLELCQNTDVSYSPRSTTTQDKSNHDLSIDGIGVTGIMALLHMGVAVVTAAARENKRDKAANQRALYFLRHHLPIFS